MVLDHERCNVSGCTMHPGWVRATSRSEQNCQIRDDWASGLWSVEELSCFWGLNPLVVSTIISREVDSTRAGTPSLEVANSC